MLNIYVADELRTLEQVLNGKRHKHRHRNVTNAYNATLLIENPKKASKEKVALKLTKATKTKKLLNLSK